MSAATSAGVDLRIVKRLLLPVAPQVAFDGFALHFAEWWPLSTHALFPDRAVRCELKPQAGGSVCEIDGDGRRAIWGSVAEWAPAARLVLLWHPGRLPDSAQEIELRFRPVASGTEVMIEHTGWERLGAQAAEMQSAYEVGWDPVLRAFRAFVGG